MAIELAMFERVAGWGKRVWDWAKGRTKELATLKKRVAELEAREKEREEFNKRRAEMTYSETEGVYWRTVNGEREGPYCPLCLEADRSIIHLIPGEPKGTYHCGIHKQDFKTADYKPLQPAIAIWNPPPRRRLFERW